MYNYLDIIIFMVEKNWATNIKRNMSLESFNFKIPSGIYLIIKFYLFHSKNTLLLGFRIKLYSSNNGFNHD